MKYIKEDMDKVKKELKEYIYNKRWIEARLMDIKERRSLLEKITNTLSDMPKGSNVVYDKQAEVLSGIIDMTNEFDDYLNRIKEKQIEVENRIDRLEQPYKNILYFKYIKGYNLTEVSNEIEEEYDYTRKLHGIALVKYIKEKENEKN